jgi:beta-N-acetylhexosaminidase
VAGFAITYLIRSGSQWNKAQAYLKGALAGLIVDPKYRGTGIGSALHSHAIDYLTTKVRESFSEATPPPEKSSIQLGSTFPRIFPGLPEGEGSESEFEKAKQWFEKRGWEFGPKKSIDLYQRLEPGRRTDLEGMMEKALSGGFTFGEPKDEEVEKLYQLQRDNFDTYTVSSALDGMELMIGMA